MSTCFLYFKSLLKDFKHTGSIIPSSKSLTHKMLEKIDFSTTDLLLELGPGTGCMTKEILKRMKKDAHLVCVEINPEFCSRLKKIRTSKKLTIIEGNVCALPELIRENTIDAVISGLPLANFPRKEVLSIFSGITTVLKEHAPYVQFQYTLRSDRILKHSFTNVLKSFTLANLPPAFVYTCSN